MSEQHVRLSSALVETIAGLTAGTATTLAVHPLDVMKTRLQIHRSTYNTPTSSFSILNSLVHSGRPIKALYRGLTPNLLGNASSWAIFFYAKSVIERQLLLFHGHTAIANTAPAFQRVSIPPFPIAQRKPAKETVRRRQRLQAVVTLSPLDYFISSGAAGLLIAVATNPIWVLKTRMVSSDKGTDGAYPSMLAGARVVWAREGWRGFYKGLGVSCLGVSHAAVQFAVYEPLKRSWLRYVARERDRHEDGDLRAERKEEREEKKLGNEATLVISGAAKLVAGTVTYPHQVIRSRLQTYDAEETFGKGIRGVVGRVWKEEGWRGFYKGLGPNVFKVMPATWVTFLVYENVRYYLPRWAV